MWREEFPFFILTCTNLQSEWCGPLLLKSEGLYSRQEAFERLVDKAPCAAELAGDIFVLAEDVATLRACLVCTINGFLFDDVKVPLLVTLTTGV